ncbi:MAG: LysR family transcriptional regulator [Cyanobacteria bacterium]|nr:LysR family transcriptional regulator [Cyanobacteriota bacterium]
MDTNQLRIFVDVMRRGSFATVARERGVDPATITRAIASLETQLKLRLFQRTTRKIQPTDAARVYFERIEPILEELQRAALSALDTGNNPQGILRIASPVSFAELNLTPLLAKFSALYPALLYELMLTDTVLDMISDHVDVAIRIGALEDSTMICHRLAEMDMRVCASPEYLEKRGRPLTPDDLKDHDCLLLAFPGFTSSNWRFTDKKDHSFEVIVKERLRTSNAIALKQCALNHMGIILQATWIVGRELREGTLIDLFPEFKVTAAKSDAAAWVVYPSRIYIPQKVKVFVNFLREAFRYNAPWVNNS